MTAPPSLPTQHTSRAWFLCFTFNTNKLFLTLYVASTGDCPDKKLDGTMKIIYLYMGFNGNFNNKEETVF